MTAVLTAPVAAAAVPLQAPTGTRLLRLGRWHVLLRVRTCGGVLALALLVVAINAAVDLATLALDPRPRSGRVVA